MVDKVQVTDAKTTADDEDIAAAPAAAPTPPPRRGPGHRGQDVRDTVAEMAARAQEISQEAGSKMASALKDVINAAAGLSTFAVESARDLVQYMVRRGQMTQEEADKLIREAEEAHIKRGGTVGPLPDSSSSSADRNKGFGSAAKKAPFPAAPAAAPVHAAPVASAPAPAPVSAPPAPPARASAPAAKKAAAAPAKPAPKAPSRSSGSAAKSSSKSSGKAAAKKTPPKKR